MKKYLYSLALAAATTLGLTSCDGKQEEPKIQWYPVVTLEGETYYEVEVNSDWTLPGYSAINTITGQDATADVEVLIYDVIAGEYVDEIDLSGPGMYNVYYVSYGSVVTTDPTVEVTREIYVFDPTITTDISGSYNVNMDETIYLANGWTFAQAAENYNELNGTSVSQCTISISQVLPGFFYFSDIFGGWYAQIRNYGSAYNMTGYVSLNSDNTLTLLSSYIAGWGDGLDYMKDGYYDEETQTISYEVLYAGQIGISLVMTNADAE